MTTDPGTLLSLAMSHALAYRRALAEDSRPPSADYHTRKLWPKRSDFDGAV